MRPPTVPGHVVLLMVVLATEWLAIVIWDFPVDHPLYNLSIILLILATLLGYVGGLEALRWTATSSRWAVETRKAASESAALVQPRPLAAAALRLCAGASLALLGLMVLHQVTQPWWSFNLELLFYLERLRLTPLGFAAALLAPALWLAAGSRRGDSFVTLLAFVASIGAVLASYYWMSEGLPFGRFLAEVVSPAIRFVLGYLHGLMVGGSVWWLAERARG